MSSADADSDSPIPDAVMQLILEFQEITGIEDIEVSRQMLERHDWDLGAAINGQMGFEPPVNQPASSSSSASQNHNDHHHHLLHDNDEELPTTSRSRRSNTTVSNQNIMPNPLNFGSPPTPRRPSTSIFRWVWKLLTTPLEFFFRYLWEFIGFGLRFLRPDPRRAITDPAADVEDFIRQYQAVYGIEHPDFFRGTYSQALQEAKRELKFLLVYLHCDDHVDTESFCRLVMPNQGYRDLIRENMVFWACSVNKPEGYRTSQALRDNTYPFLALIVLKNNRMTVVGRIEGVINPDEVLSRLHQGVADNEAFLVAERADRMERSMTQTLRQQQDEAYLESLKADQEKDRKKREEEEKKRQKELEVLRLENEEKERKESLRQKKSNILLNLKPEPPADAPEVIRVLIKFPNGTRLERRFLSTDSLKHLYNFVFSHPQAPDLFEITTNFPKRTLPCKPDEEQEAAVDPPSFKEFGLSRNEMLFVYDLES